MPVGNSINEKCLKKGCFQCITWGVALSWPILTNTQAFLKPLVLKICQSEPMKVLVDGQMNTFSDQ